MATPRRFSLNTSLKNANIFEEYLSDNATFADTPVDIDVKPAVQGQTLTKSPFKVVDFELRPIKQEPPEIDTKPCVSSLKTALSRISSANQESFWNIKEEVKSESSPRSSRAHDESTNEETSRDSTSLKAIKKRTSTRHSPYVKHKQEIAMMTDKIDHCVRKLSLHKTEDAGAKKSEIQKNRKHELETDSEVLARRQKQIDFGKNTIGYDNYIRSVPRNRRKKDEPSTPDKYRKFSRRGWDSLIKLWRLKLHNYD